MTKRSLQGYEKFAKAEIRKVAVHKGLFTQSDEKNFCPIERVCQG